MEDVGTIEAFQELLGIRFGAPEILAKALTHSSAKSAETPCNERLEFLGDSVLGLVIADALFRSHPNFTEGDLTQVKSVVVSSRMLARVGKDRGFEPFITVGKGLKRTKGLPPSLVAGVVEAVIGAIFLDQGLDEARRFILDVLSAQIDRVLNNRYRRNYKSMLQNHCQKILGVTPVYRVVSESGPDHGKTFEVVAVVGARRFAPGRGRSKKEAEQYAAEFALAALSAEQKPCLPVPAAQAAMPVPWGDAWQWFPARPPAPGRPAMETREV